MHRDVIRPRAEFRHVHQFDAEFRHHLLGHVRVIGNDLHLEPHGPVGDNGADAADADDTQHLAVDLAAHELLLLPFARLHGGGGLGDVAGQGHHHGDSVLGGGGGVAVRRIHNDDAALAGRRHIDIIEADTSPAHDLQVVGQRDDLGVHLGGAADNQAVIGGNNLLQFLGRQAGVDINLQARFPQNLRADGLKIIADEYLHHLSLWQVKKP